MAKKKPARRKARKTKSTAVRPRARASRKARGRRTNGRLDGPDEEDELVEDLVIVPVRNMILFPGVALPLLLGREASVLAVRAAGRFAVGDVPFYGQSFLGAGPDLRGYAVGTVRGDNLLAAQAEYRRELFWRLGAVAFGGVGTVFDELSQLDSAEAFPSAGFGLRLLLEKDNHVNFRVDFAWGDGQDAIYVSVGEAC